MHQISILSNGNHIMYEERNGYWEFPTKVSIEGYESNSLHLWFELLTIFCKNDYIDKPKDVHILCTYEPTEAMINEKEAFIKRYHDNLESQEISAKNMTIH